MTLIRQFLGNSVYVNLLQTSSRGWFCCQFGSEQRNWPNCNDLAIEIKNVQLCQSFQNVRVSDILQLHAISKQTNIFSWNLCLRWLWQWKGQPMNLLHFANHTNQSGHADDRHRQNLCVCKPSSTMHCKEALGRWLPIANAITHVHHMCLCILICIVDPENFPEGQGKFYWRILLWILHLKVLVWFLLNTQNKPERWHKLNAMLRRSRVLEGACFHGGFRGGFCGGLRADFRADFLADFWRIFWRIFRQIFRWILQRIFQWILIGIAGGFSWNKFPKPAKKTWEISPKTPQENPAQIILACGSLPFSGCSAQVWPGNAPPPPPNPPECWGGWWMLRGMLVC